MDASVVEEIKVDVLHKEAVGIPVGRPSGSERQTDQVKLMHPGGVFA